ncbi:MAG: beta-hydroxyacyl-ACP dehydratase [Thiopseudomonas sp.]|nr:beta-hydroxyacyl-ACP dehydratase [Thiopseudomonas sp.]
MTPADLHPLLPHRDAALWLHSIDAHDRDRIRGTCSTDCLQQLHEASPVLLFEAAAQLCAAHGALYAGELAIKSAHIGKVSAVRQHAALNPNTEFLQLQATRLSHSEQSALYRFDISQHQQPLLDGQLLVVLSHA